MLPFASCWDHCSPGWDTRVRPSNLTARAPLRKAFTGGVWRGLASPVVQVAVVRSPHRRPRHPLFMWPLRDAAAVVNPANPEGSCKSLEFEIAVTLCYKGKKRGTHARMPRFDETKLAAGRRIDENQLKARASQCGGRIVTISGIVLHKSAPVVAAASCGDLAEGKCKIQLSTGITMAYVETGPASGKPVILVHGYTDSVRSWSFAMRVLHKTDPSLRLIAIDLRGHGDSTMPPASDCASAPEKCFHPDILATDVVAFMKAKGISRAEPSRPFAWFVRIGQSVALSDPEMVDHLVLVATSTKVVDNPVIRDFILRDTIEGSWKCARSQRQEISGGLLSADAARRRPGSDEVDDNCLECRRGRRSATLVP